MVVVLKRRNRQGVIKLPPCELHEAKIVSFSETSCAFSAILGSFRRSILSVNFEPNIEGNGGELTELCYRLHPL